MREFLARVVEDSNIPLSSLELLAGHPPQALNLEVSTVGGLGIQSGEVITARALVKVEDCFKGAKSGGDSAQASVETSEKDSTSDDDEEEEKLKEMDQALEEMYPERGRGNIEAFYRFSDLRREHAVKKQRKRLRSMTRGRQLPPFPTEEEFQEAARRMERKRRAKLKREEDEEEEEVEEEARPVTRRRRNTRKDDGASGSGRK